MAETKLWLANSDEYWSIMTPNYILWKKGVQAITLGVKIHISAVTASARPLADLVIPYLQAQVVFHKLLSRTELIDMAREDNQKRKFITIYPQDPVQLTALANGIDTLIMNTFRPSHRGPNARCYPIEHEFQWGKSGYVFLRHGYFDKDDPKDNRDAQTMAFKMFILEGKTEGLFVGRG